MPAAIRYDLAIVGAGILGLAHALAATRLGLKTIVIDRDAQANGASVRNFGFITVSGQERGKVWQRAMRSRDVWKEIAPAAGIEIVHRETLVIARRPEAMAVVNAFMQTEMGEGCAALSPVEVALRQPHIETAKIAGALHSPHELRVDSRTAIPLLAKYLEDKGVTFRRQTAVTSVKSGKVQTSRGNLNASRVVVCPGDDLATLFPERIAARDVQRCKLHMMRLAEPGFRLAAAIMSDLGLARYAGYADLPEADALKARLRAEQAGALENGVHLIVVQNADGTLVVGDSHHYAPTPDPFSPEHVDRIILDEFGSVFGGRQPAVIERWTGTYASAKETMFVDAPAADIRLAMITSGTGASTSFAIAEEVIGDLFATSDFRRPLS